MIQRLRENTSVAVTHPTRTAFLLDASNRFIFTPTRVSMNTDSVVATEPLCKFLNELLAKVASETWSLFLKCVLKVFLWYALNVYGISAKVEKVM